jgi:hypothetical protein
MKRRIAMKLMYFAWPAYRDWSRPGLRWLYIRSRDYLHEQDGR